MKHSHHSQSLPLGVATSTPTLPPPFRGGSGGSGSPDHDAWARYLPHVSVTSDTSVTSQVNPVTDELPVTDASVTPESSVTPSSWDVTDVTDVTDTPGPTTAHKWFLVDQTGEHGRDCPDCRRAPGGPDNTNERTTP